VVQSSATALDARLQEPGAVRIGPAEKDQSSLNLVSIKSGQVHLSI
jgi:hypothetical protein